jgi:hypothetical protein
MGSASASALPSLRGAKKHVAPIADSKPPIEDSKPFSFAARFVREEQRNYGTTKNELLRRKLSEAAAALVAPVPALAAAVPSPAPVPEAGGFFVLEIADDVGVKLPPRKLPPLEPAARRYHLFVDQFPQHRPLVRDERKGNER